PRAEALQEVHEAGVVADQDARLVPLDAADDPQRGVPRARLRRGLETLDHLRAPRIVGDADPGARRARDRRRDAAGMHYRQLHRAARHRKLVPHAFGEAAHGELRRRIGRLSRRSDDAEDRGQVDDMRLGLRLQMRQEGARAVHHAPEIDVEQPLHLRL
ncbi:hypothetical protein KXV85_005058, partial [Aspergillus fumigatus]